MYRRVIFFASIGGPPTSAIAWLYIVGRGKKLNEYLTERDFFIPALLVVSLVARNLVYTYVRICIHPFVCVYKYVHMLDIFLCFGRLCNQ